MKTLLPFKSGTGVPPVILLRQLRRGFTLIELTIAMGIGIAISGMIMVLFNQQLAFLRIYRSQSFLTEEAPIISMHVAKLIGKADSFRLHDSMEDAKAGKRSAPGAKSPVVVLNYRQPDGTMGTSILSFEDRGDGDALYFYVVRKNIPLSDPQWSITNKPSKVEFWMEEGVLRMALEGPLDPKNPDYIPEQITYSGTMQL